MTEEKSVIQRIKERKWQWIGHRLRKAPRAVERKFSIGTRRDGVREEDLKDMEENSRGRDWESGKKLERSWILGPKQDLLEALCS
jgi:hypothetical protein